MSFKLGLQWCIWDTVQKNSFTCSSSICWVPTVYFTRGYRNQGSHPCPKKAHCSRSANNMGLVKCYAIMKSNLELYLFVCFTKWCVSMWSYENAQRCCKLDLSLHTGRSARAHRRGPRSAQDLGYPLPLVLGSPRTKAMGCSGWRLLTMSMKQEELAGLPELIQTIKNCIHLFMVLFIMKVSVVLRRHTITLSTSPLPFTSSSITLFFPVFLHSSGLCGVWMTFVVWFSFHPTMNFLHFAKSQNPDPWEFASPVSCGFFQWILAGVESLK